MVICVTILLYIILYIIHILLSYLILYSSLLLFYLPSLLFPFYSPPKLSSSVPSSPLPIYLLFPSLYNPLIQSIRVGIWISLFIFSSDLSNISPPPNHSIRVGTYIYLFIYSSDLPNPPELLTPHVLSEWMVEWCSFISIRLCWESCWCFHLGVCFKNSGFEVFLCFECFGVIVR